MYSSRPNRTVSHNLTLRNTFILRKTPTLIIRKIIIVINKTNYITKATYYRVCM